MKYRKNASVRSCAPRHGLVTAAWCLAALVASTPAFAHHGFGRFDRTKPVEIEGVIKSIDFVNPHSYLNLDVRRRRRQCPSRCAARCARPRCCAARGGPRRCSSRVRRRTIFGCGHRDDPAACYLEDITIGDAPKRNRNDQFTTSAVDTIEPAARAGRRASRTSRAIGRRSNTSLPCRRAAAATWCRRA